MFWKKCIAFLVIMICLSYMVFAQEKLNLQPDLGDYEENNKTTVNLQPNFGNNDDKNKTLDCECVPFYQCRNGTVNVDGAGIFTIRKQDDSCPIITEICCNITAPPSGPTTSGPTLQSTPTSATLKPTTIPPPKGCGFRNPDGVSFKVTGNAENEAQFGEFPWVVAIIKQEEGKAFDPRPSCGGALIHPQAVITAAHCLKSNETYFVRVGEWDINNENEIYGHQDIKISGVSLHPQFYSAALFYDVAFVYLVSPVMMYPHISYICLPPKDTYVDAGRCYSSGWGKKEFGKKGSYSIVLKKVDLPQVPRDTCQTLLRDTRLGHHFTLHTSFICAGGEKGKDTCDGDGGSPLVCPIKDEPNRFYQAGIVAWGIGCGEENIPGVYANVALIRDWIDEEMLLHGLDYTYHY